MINTQQQERKKNEPFDIEIIDPKSFEYESKKVPYNSYKYASVQPVGNTVNFTAASGTVISGAGQVSKFQLPCNDTIMNLSKMVLNFQIIVGVNTAGLNNNLNIPPPSSTPGAVLCPWRYFMPFIQNLQLKSGSGTFLCDVTNVDKYSRATSIYNRSTTKESTTRGFACKSQRSGIINYITPAGAPPIDGDASFISDPYLNRFADATPIASQNYADTADEPGVISFATLQTAPGSAGTNTSQYPLVLNNGSRVVTTPPVGRLVAYQYSIRLGELLHHSIFNVDKNLFFNNNLFLEITWNTASNCFVYCKPTTTTALGIFTLPANLAYEIQNLNLTYAFQRDPLMIQMVKEIQQNTELPITIPFIQVQSSNSFPTAGNQTSTFRISTNNPLTALEQVYFAPFQQDNGANNVNGYDNSSNLQQVLGFNTMYDSLVIQQNSDVLCNFDLLNTNADVAISRSIYKNNGITSLDAVRYSGCVPYMFDGDNACEVYDGNTIKGLPIINNNDMIMNCTISANNPLYTPLVHYLFSVTLRTFYWFKGNYYTSKQIF